MSNIVGPYRTTSYYAESDWLRPKVLRAPDPQKEPILFQQMNIDHYEQVHLDGFLELAASMYPVIRMFGVTRDGHSILCHVHGFHPYFYTYTAQKPDPQRLEQFREHLDSMCKSNGDCRVSPLCKQILRVEHVVSRSIYGYSGKEEQNFLKIVCTVPQVMRAAANVFQKGDVQSLGVYFPGQPDDRGHRLFETNIEYEIRFMVDNKVYGCSWVELPAQKYKLREKKDFQSLCQLECDINYVDFIAHPPEGDWAGVAPLRTLSFDIETYVRGNCFPQPERDSVLQIGNVLQKQGDHEHQPLIKCIFTLNSCAPIEGATIRSFDTEQEMLLSWARFIADTDADIITGWNIKLFDIQYLLKRAKFLGLEGFSHLGRITAEAAITQANIGASSRSQPGANEIGINFEGRIVIDLLLVMRTIKYNNLANYKLNTVSSHFLNEKKEDVHFTEISRLFEKDYLTRRRLAVYCLKDALLPLLLNDKLKLITKYMEMARVTGLPQGYLQTRMEHFKMFSLILREARQHNYIIPDITVTSGDKSTSATASQPKSKRSNSQPGDEKLPYSRIIIAHNLCYTTLLNRAAIDRHKLEYEDFIITPIRCYFKKPDDDQRTVLPEILRNLERSIKRTEVELKNEQLNAAKKNILTGRLLALKDTENSMHLFTGPLSPGLPCMEIYKSVKSFPDGDNNESWSHPTKRQRC